ncbi:MAG: ATP phosphoribosyltransferase regulatory subunit [Cycloclasticus sp.]|nr:ATP phosphoribosyltransferase regulatory subunit [Cycloclasticus sp.]MBG95544.1 ATP phosphoribosyltransferase regulatory subunit [Cycloclasticus sp.]HAI96926.1 ATP phosphoribosyltransferase regulatory subunit [Methylococcaceae bacterium]|tara:strand:- start:379 stop:1551 length:1173 start_codon:yes stop_codon:yes gene_type:complete
MAKDNNWMLPEGIDALLPNEAARLEKMRRELLDLFQTWGYQYVIPPMVEFRDTLLTGTGSELALQTFNLTDQISGKALGIRADMTPQVARMASHHLYTEAPVRLCYLGSILQARGAKIEKSRSPIQVGVELYGSQHIRSDIEIIRLMLETLAIAGLQEIHLDLGHVAIFRGLAKKSGMTQDEEAELFEVIQRKATEELDDLLTSFNLEPSWKKAFHLLLDLNGDISVLKEAKTKLAIGGAEVIQAIEELQRVAELIQAIYPALPLYFDLGELRCYQYQTGIVFAAFVPGFGSEVARGGRYDNFTEPLDSSLPATGFSADIKVLSRLSSAIVDDTARIILAPDTDDLELHNVIRDIRASGDIVIQELPGNQKQPEHTAVIEKIGGRWQVSE